MVTVTGDQASDLSLTAGSDPGFLVRGHGGAFVSLALSERLAVQTEIAIVQRGADWEKSVTSNDTTSTATQSVELVYLEIPLLLQYTLPSSGKVRPYLSAGPTIALHVRGETKFELEAFHAGIKISQFDDYFDDLDNVKSTIFGAVVASGIGVKMGANELSFEGRYTRSFGATFEDVSDLSLIPAGSAVIVESPSGNALDVQHSAFSILIGYGFGIDL
jgi:hypothetical protein